MAKFTRTTAVKGSIKGIVSNGEVFIDSETGMEIDVCEMLYQIYQNSPFDISTSFKADEEIQ